MNETSACDRTWGNEEAASYLGCTPCTLRVWVSQRRVPHVKVGRLTRILKSDLDAWLAQRRVDVEIPLDLINAHST